MKKVFGAVLATELWLSQSAVQQSLQAKQTQVFLLMQNAAKLQVDSSLVSSL